MNLWNYFILFGIQAFIGLNGGCTVVGSVLFFPCIMAYLYKKKYDFQERKRERERLLNELVRADYDPEVHRMGNDCAICMTDF